MGEEEEEEARRRRKKKDKEEEEEEGEGEKEEEKRKKKAALPHHKRPSCPARGTSPTAKGHSRAARATESRVPSHPGQRAP